MGRNFAGQAGIDIYNRADLDLIDRALQHGSPKWLEAGQARACYALLSNNTSSAQGGAAFFDKYFQPVRPAFYQSSSGQNSQGNTQYTGNNDLQTQASLFMGAAATQSQASSSGTTNYLNATNVAGEFGNALVDAFSNSTLVSAYNRSAQHYSNKHMLNRSFINSDHADRGTVYINVGQKVRAVSRVHGDYQFNKIGTKDFTLTDLHASGHGMMSYNAKRKELIGITYTGGNGAMKVISYRNVDFDRFPSPHIALNRPEVTKTIKTIATLASWGVNNNESAYNAKPVLCDDGTIFLSVMFSSSAQTLYKFARNAQLDITPSVIGSRTLTTSYGAEQDATSYGQRAMQSRDASAVLVFCPYYYYGTGMASWIVDRKKSVHVNATWMQNSNTAAGIQPLPYGDSGFAAYFCGNVYAGNPTGSNILGATERDGDGDMVQMASAMYLPYFTMPNTTNYPGMTQVVDYSLLDNQYLY